MAVKDLFVDFDTFRNQVHEKEVGIIQLIADDYLKRLADIVHSSGTYTYRERMYLPYPFQTSYTSRCVDNFLADTKESTSKYYEWYKKNRINIDMTTELPVFTHENTFDAYLKNRLDKLLQNSITMEEFAQYADKNVLVYIDRKDFLIYDRTAEITEDDSSDTVQSLKICNIRDKSLIRPASKFPFMGPLEYIFVLNNETILHHGKTTEQVSVIVGYDYDNGMELIMPALYCGERIVENGARKRDPGEYIESLDDNTTIYLSHWEEY